MNIIRFVKRNLFFFCMTFVAYAESPNSTIFPIENYDQKISTWLNPKSGDYTSNLLDSNYQKQRLTQLKHLYFGTENKDYSPWSETYVTYIFTPQNGKTIAGGEKYYVEQFDNSNKPPQQRLFAINYREYPKYWIKAIQTNMNIDQFENLTYNPNNRAIMTDNALVRILPTYDLALYNSKLPGEGYPFDNLQISNIYAGTPVYIIGSSVDKKWLLILSPDYIGWVDSRSVALTDTQFIRDWQQAAYNNNLAGIMQNNISIIDDKQDYSLPGFIGMILPVYKNDANSVTVMLPIKRANRMAKITTATLASSSAVILPIPASKANFARIIKQLQFGQYGWGGIGFYFDCSSEMKAIFSLFGIYLPRNTGSQMLTAKMTDLTSYYPYRRRLTYLKNHGIPLLTLVHINGHIFLYVGNFEDNYGNIFAQTYQQMWGLSPKDRSYRAIVGMAVFLPLLPIYPEDVNLLPEYKESLFQLIYLNQWPLNAYKPDLSVLLY